jgi:hypothetical protein
MWREVTSPVGLLRGALHPKRRAQTPPRSSGQLADQASETIDRHLIHQIASGNVDALGELFDRHGQLCWTVARKLTRDAWIADEAVHNTFLTVWRHTPDLADESVLPRLIALTYHNSVALRTS